MKLRTCVLILAALPFLGACSQYTDKTSPCLGRDGAPVVTRAAVTLVAPDTVQQDVPKDCVFEPVSFAV